MDVSGKPITCPNVSNQKPQRQDSMPSRGFPVQVHHMSYTAKEFLAVSPSESLWEVGAPHVQKVLSAQNNTK